MNIQISLKCYNRPIYLYRVLDALSRCKNLELYNPIIMSCDATDNNMLNQIIEAIKLTNVKVNLFFHQQKLGCARNTEFCLQKSFEDPTIDYAIHFEDDTLPAENAICYYEQVLPLLDQNDYFSAIPFHRPCHETEKPNPDDNGLVAKKFFDGSGGFGIGRNQWNKIDSLGGLKSVVYISEQGRRFESRGAEWLKEIKTSNIGGFVFYMDRYLSCDKYSIFPKVSVVKNIGKIGEHLRTPGLHENIHENNNWCGSPEYKPIFDYDTKNITVDSRKFVEDRIQDG